MNRNEPLIIKPVSNGFLLEQHAESHGYGPADMGARIVFDDKDKMLDYLCMHYNAATRAEDLLPPIVDDSPIVIPKNMEMSNE